jgi:hypothetical protein
MWKANAAQADKEDLQWAKEHPNGAARQLTLPVTTQ